MTKFSKFQVGDLVRCTESNFNQFGIIVKVRNVHEATVLLYCATVHWDNGNNGYVFSDMKTWKTIKVIEKAKK